ncbi:MAG: LptA/OstA family protein [Edaphobacter sp.]|uniref:LptA/OstA family protein n=1 Tax=Edaphobacter sp. TaxID=1934404 RepID=UPI00238A841F|nr:LptA/OstA family protein [Edaphobacter sp.]MDE1177598.1 LptA/OstA family protein [Edaphobacter sp.]
MRVSVDRLRIWLLAGAGLLVLVVAGFLGLAHWRVHRFITELPRKLGADVRQETNAFTWSQTVKGRVVFTLHAAKAIQHKDGMYTLHDVGVAVYGHGQAQNEETPSAKKNERVDRIYGKEFDLDQNTGVVKAIGEVHMDLEAPAAKDAKGKMDYAAGTDIKEPPIAASAPAGPGTEQHEAGQGDLKLIHVKTTNLVYLQKLGTAATDEDIEFEYNGLTGHAKGAEYNSDTGILILHAAVKANGLQNGKPVLLTASRAELDRDSHTVTLNDAEYLTVSGGGEGPRGRQTVRAQHAVILLRDGGGIEHIQGETGVTLTAGDGVRVTGDHGEVWFNEHGKAQNAHIWGNVTYAADDETRHATGNSSEARIAFDKQGNAEHVVLNGAVKLSEHVLTAAATQGAAKQAWSDRQLSATAVEMGLASDAAGRSHPRDAKATGNAKLRVVDSVATGKGTRSNAMSGDVLTAQFVTGSDGTSRLDQVHGSGRTVLEQTTEAGVVNTSNGDTLEVRFREAAKGAASGSKEMQGAEIANAVQQGHVVVTRHTPAKAEGMEPEMDKATAERATFDGNTQMLALSGNVQVNNAEGTMWSDRLLVNQVTGDGAAEGGVKASYQQGPQAAMVHVMASRADLKKAGGTAIFHGEAGRPARLWQNGSQVEAPVLEFNQKRRDLIAHGEGAGVPMVVHTVLVSTGETSQPVEKTAAAKPDSMARKGSVVRIASREMHYSDTAHEAEFTGGVRIESADGVMRGERAVALLDAGGQKAAAPKAQASAAGFLGGGLQRVTVTGSILIDQPGRRATGDRLVYTAGDGWCVLTGTAAVPPRVVDQAHGTVTGGELRFRSTDESVVISNGEKGSSGPRVHTETRVKRDR